ncbi:replication-associated recombination protein A [bacterium]|nr:MAG: replication-associated recombination protein A [bacterium]
MDALFPTNAAELANAPLADRMRPRTLDEVVGQDALLGEHGPLRLLLEGDSLPSLLLWGPPGCGKTTVARLAAVHTRARFLEYSAVAVGAKEIKAVMVESEKLARATGQHTILFLDEIHRFNKAQQDALLPWVEKGAVTLIGATTENPSFEVNSALISRTRLFVLQPLDAPAVRLLLERSLTRDTGLAGALRLTDGALDALAVSCEGDARAALGLLETLAAAVAAGAVPGAPDKAVDTAMMTTIVGERAARFDKGGDEHFNVVSALHKSLRNSDVQAAVYWLGRQLAGGEDPLYIARRLVRFASEDVGLADPQALGHTLAVRDAVHFLGPPEGDLALTQAVVYLALAPKSNALYRAHNSVIAEVARGNNPPVPLHLRNAPTRLMRELDHGKGYRYAPDAKAGIADMNCLPDSLSERAFYEPGRWGFETELAQRMDGIRRWQAKQQSRRNAGDIHHDDEGENP